MMVTLRLTPTEREALDRLASAWGLSRSDALRRAFLEREESGPAEGSFADRMRDVCGKYDSGLGDLSMRSRELFERHIEEKHGHPRPRAR